MTLLDRLIKIERKYTCTHVDDGHLTIQSNYVTILNYYYFKLLISCIMKVEVFELAVGILYLDGYGIEFF